MTPMSSPDPRDVATMLNMGRDPTAVDQEIQSNIFCGVLQRRRSMFYARSYGCAPMEGAPTGIQFLIDVRYRIARWVAERNAQVGDGSGGTVDRRAITSQNLVTVSGMNQGVNVGNVQVGSSASAAAGRASGSR